jgi:hypothetical protein
MGLNERRAAKYYLLMDGSAFFACVPGQMLLSSVCFDTFLVKATVSSEESHILQAFSPQLPSLSHHCPCQETASQLGHLFTGRIL